VILSVFYYGVFLNMKSKQGRFLAALQKGQNFTEGQVASRFGIKNVTATVSNLRSQGFCIYANKTNGMTTYRLGTPTRAVIAAGIRALRNGEYVNLTA
jgi:hypothetical protein